MSANLKFQLVDSSFFDYLEREHPNAGPNYVGNGPSSLRSAVSRYQYAFYLTAKDRLTDKYVCGGGAELYEGQCFLAKRLWVDPAYRLRFPIIDPLLRYMVLTINQMNEIGWIGVAPEDRCLPFQDLVLSFEEHNVTLYLAFVRLHEAKRPDLLGSWSDLFKLFRPSGVRLVHGVKQYTCTASYQEVLQYVLDQESINKGEYDANR